MNGAVGVDAASIELYMNVVGAPQSGVQPTPSPQPQIGLTGVDETLRPSPKYVEPRTQTPSVSALGFVRPQKERTEIKFGWFTKNLHAAFKGLINAAVLSWDAVDKIESKTVAIPESYGVFSGFDAIDAVTVKTEDLGRRQLIHRAQSFDNFAGGLLRSVRGVTGRTEYLRWDLARDFEKGKKGLIESENRYIENQKQWADQYLDLLPPRSRTIQGQGTGALFTGAPTNVGADVPVRRGLI